MAERCGHQKTYEAQVAKKCFVDRCAQICPAQHLGVFLRRPRSRILVRHQLAKHVCSAHVCLGNGFRSVPVGVFCAHTHIRANSASAARGARKGRGDVRVRPVARHVRFQVTPHAALLLRSHRAAQQELHQAQAVNACNDKVALAMPGQETRNGTGVRWGLRMPGKKDRDHATHQKMHDTSVHCC